nr:ribonuclease H-like domain, reverse transcriptase, RNA-dependent DNA polymerase [Tanacetum cinerariifolium]
METEHAQEYYVLPLWSSYTSTIKSSKAKNGDEKLNEDTDSKTNEELVDEADQAFLEELERLKRQVKEATDAAETHRKTFAQSTEDLLLQEGALQQDEIFTSLSYNDEGAVGDFTNLEPTVNISQALEDESWVDAMQEELLQFKIQNVWIFVDLPFGKKAIGTKWVYKNKKHERSVVVRNKAMLVAEGHRQEEGIDYDEYSISETNY